MNKIQMFLNNPANLELEMGDFNIGLNYSFNDIRDISKRNGSYSKTIVIPGTKNNNFVLGGLFDINADFTLFNPNKKTQAKLLVNSEIVIDGFLHLTNIRKLSNVDPQGNSIFYDMVIFSNAIDLMSELGDAELKDLSSLDIYNHDYLSDTIVNSWTNTWEDGYVYPMIGTQFDDSKYNIRNFYPTSFYKAVLDAVITEAGYGWGGSFKDNPQFEKEILPYTGNGLPKISAVDTADSGFKVGVTTDLNRGFNGGFVKGPEFWSPLNSSLDTTIIAPFTQIITDAGNQWSAGNFEADIKKAGSYRFKYDFNFKMKYINPYSTVINFFNNWKYRLIYQVERKGPTALSFSVIDTFMIDNIGSPGPVAANNSRLQSLSINGTTNDFLLAKDDKIRIRIKAYTITGKVEKLALNKSADDLENAIVFDGINTLELISLTDTLSIGGKVRLQDYLPKFKQKDLLSDLIKRYNLIIHIDEDNPNILLFDSYNDYYANNTEILDWSDKKDYSREDDIKLLSELQFKKVKYTYTKEDTADDINVDYYGTTNEIYGEVDIVFDNDFVTGDKIIQSPFSPTPTVKTSFGAYLPSINRDNPIGNPRVLFYGGLKDLDGNNTWSLDGISRSRYPYAGHFDDPILPNLDLNFDICRYYFFDDTIAYTSNTQYSKYWGIYINQISNGKLLTAYFNLNETDIRKIRNNLSFKVWIKDAYYYINKVFDYNPLKNDVTKVELIKVEELGGYLDEGIAPSILRGSDACPNDLTVVEYTSTTGGPKIYIYMSESNQVVTEDCCDSLGGFWNANTNSCELMDTTTYYVTTPPSIIARKQNVNTAYDGISIGTNNLLAGTRVESVTDEDGNLGFVSKINNQFVLGNDNEALYDKTLVVGDSNVIENSSITILNGSGNTVSSVGTTLIGAVDQTIDDPNRVYLGDKFKVDTKTGERYIDGISVEQVLQKALRIRADDIATLHNTPIVLLVAQGESKYIDLLSATCYVDFNTTAYSGDNDLEIYVNTAEQPVFIGEDYLLTGSSVLYNFKPYAITSPETQTALNEPLEIKLTNAVTDGDSDIIIIYSYKVVDLTGI
jgi:hypothetical protein